MPEAWDDLDEYLRGPEPDYEAPAEPPENGETADKWLRWIAHLDRRANEVRAAVQTQRDALDRYEAEQLWPLAKRREWFMDALAQYHRAVLARQPRRKTIELTNGVLRARAKPLAYEFDEEQFIAWARTEAPDLLRFTPPMAAVDKNAVKKALAVNEDGGYCVDSDGVKVPGVTVAVQPDSYTVEVKP